MAKLLKNKLDLEGIIENVSNITSVRDLRTFLLGIYKQLIEIKDIFFIIERMEDYFFISSEKEYLLINNDILINTLKNNKFSNAITIISENRDINDLIKNEKVISFNLQSNQKEIGYLLFTLGTQEKQTDFVVTKDLEIIISLISMKINNIVLSESNKYISDSKNLKVINKIIKKAISTIHISELLDFICEYLVEQDNFGRVFAVIGNDKNNTFQGSLFDKNGIQKVQINNLIDISNIHNYRLLTEQIKNEPEIKIISDPDTFIAFAIIIRGKTVGFIAVDNSVSKRKIKNSEIYLLQSIATQISISVDNSILYEDMQLNALGFKKLFEVASSFNLIIDYEQAAKVVVEKICSTINVSQGYLISFEVDNYSRVISARNEESQFLGSEIDLSDKMKFAIADKRIVFYDYDDNNKDKCFDLKTALIVPLYIKNRLTGILCIGEKNEKRVFSDYDLKLVKTISNQAVVTLENAQLYNKLEDMVVERTVELIDSNKALQNQKEKLEILSQRLQSIISSIPDGILVVNKEDQILGTNPAFIQMLKFINEDIQIESLTGLSVNKLINLISNKEDNNKTNFEQLLNDIINPPIIETENNDVEEKYSTSHNLVLENGITHYYKVLTAPIKIEHGQKFKPLSDKKSQVVVFHDVTKEKEIDKMKSDFIAVVSHELKTPVSAMMGFATLIEDGIAGDITHEQQEYLYKIQMQGERLIRLINDLLDFSKLEAGQMPLYLQLLDADDVVNEIVETLRPLADEKTMTLRASVDLDLPPIYVDPDKLKQILINLISNAIKFTPEVTGLIEVKVIFDSQKEELLFSVSDNGIGIPEKDKPRLFDRFYQVDNTSTRKYGGTGLGLAIVKKLVDLNHGELWVDTKIGKGSIFYFTVPLPEKEE